MFLTGKEDSAETEETKEKRYILVFMIGNLAVIDMPAVEMTSEATHLWPHSPVKSFLAPPARMSLLSLH